MHVALKYNSYCSREVMGCVHWLPQNIELELFNLGFRQQKTYQRYQLSENLILSYRGAKSKYLFKKQNKKKTQQQQQTNKHGPKIDFEISCIFEYSIPTP